MAQISINDEIIVNGKLTVKRFYDENKEVKIIGTFATHLYFEEIKTLTTYRYRILEVEVVEEIFASDDYDIVYSFIANSLENVHGATNLSNEQMEAIENNIYGVEGYLLSTDLEIEVRKLE